MRKEIGALSGAYRQSANDSSEDLAACPPTAPGVESRHGHATSDNDIDREIREAETYTDAADRALAERAVTEWKTLDGARRRATQAGLVADGWRCRCRPVLFTRPPLPQLPAEVDLRTLVGTNARRRAASFRS